MTRWIKVNKRWYLDTDCVVWVQESTLVNGNFFTAVLLAGTHKDESDFFKTIEEAMQAAYCSTFCYYWMVRGGETMNPVAKIRQLHYIQKLRNQGDYCRCAACYWMRPKS